MTTNIAGVILAGGLARRMGGGDKPLITVDGQTLLERTITRLAPQVGKLLLNANGDPARFATYGLDIRADVIDGYGGPLVGILTGLEWAQSQGVDWLVSAAADTPLFPADLVACLLTAVQTEGADMAMALSGGHTHPVFALWPVHLADDLRRAVVDHDIRKIEAFTDRYKVAHVEWSQKPYDPFFNVNAPEDVVRLEMILNGTLPSEPPLQAALPVAVMVERKDSSANPWVTETWRPLAVITDPPPGPAWVMLRQSDGFEHYLAAAPDLTLHRSDLASYRYNLGGADPRLFVVVRKTGQANPPVQVIMVTAAPDEAQKMSESGEDQVESLPLPAPLLTWIQTFCASHPPDEPMRKRRRDRLDADRAFSPKEGRP
ncbi:MAG: molybdenum cofactor guanylyltransferase MobA [Rhodospirillaceae bacterium]|nr:molybdenum cofactor guanylyltransferase MobA [Rhodospirillales bacterium]